MACEKLLWFARSVWYATIGTLGIRRTEKAPEMLAIEKRMVCYHCNAGISTHWKSSYACGDDNAERRIWYLQPGTQFYGHEYWLVSIIEDEILLCGIYGYGAWSFDNDLIRQVWYDKRGPKNLARLVTSGIHMVTAFPW